MAEAWESIHTLTTPQKIKERNAISALSASRRRGVEGGLR